MKNNGLTIGSVSQRTGLAASAIRYYEEEGLVHPFRTDTGQRRFDRGDIRRLSFVMIAQNLGFTISEIREVLRGLPEGRTPTKADWGRISKQFRRDLDQRIEQMHLLRKRLDGCIGCGCLSMKACSLYNPDDAIQRKGKGPRFLMGDSLDAS